uniref:Dickkopf WNT signaling pathway inhibitor 1b n=1 Tax=Paramormyrops kingsleyae TaxID=1676925 RepID=A0A3B3QY22_9TELE|nr:dickkopf-related protein 1 [Paramormyrops kingsleyae]
MYKSSITIAESSEETGNFTSSIETCELHILKRGTIRRPAQKLPERSLCLCVTCHSSCCIAMLLVLVHPFLAVFCTLYVYFGGTHAGSALHNSNSIKSLPGGAANPGHPVSASPDILPFDSGNQNTAIDPVQPLSCSTDEECGDEEFCYGSRGACLPCRKRRKRCIRDAVCCPGNHCSNGLCLPIDPATTQQARVDATAAVTLGQENSTIQPHSKRPLPSRSQSLKGQEGENCLRSTDCSEGLCCARHFWSKICKPVLKEGQVCTKHRRKGTHGLEIFQRCDCGDGLSCRTQKGNHSNKAARSLHTCQRH